MASLAWGAKNYSTGVLENQLRYYVLRNGTVAYRGIELPQSARGLTVMAQYYRQTGDPEGLIVKYRCVARFYNRFRGQTTTYSALNCSVRTARQVPGTLVVH